MKLPLILSFGLAYALICPAQEPPSKAAPGQFERLDRDHDGKISKEEMPEALKPNFDRVDTNHDGGISKEEHLAVIGNRKNAGPAQVPEGIEIPRDLAYADTDNSRQTCSRK